MFNRYRIPRENLLNRTGDVTPDGDYETSFTDPQRILSKSFFFFLIKKFLFILGILLC